MKGNILQVENMNYIRNQFGKELWVQVYGNREMYRSDGLFWVGLIPNEDIEESLKSTDWDLNMGITISPGFVGYGNNNYQYDRFSGSEVEPLIIERDFHGIKESSIEISEEFRLLNNLYFDYNQGLYNKVSENGELESVVKVEENNVFIKLNYLKRYAALKQMGIALFFDIRYDSTESLEELDLVPATERFDGSDCCFDYYSNNYDSTVEDKKAYSIIHGKKIIFGISVEESGYWPYDKKKEYEEFIVGIDEDGNEVKFTCNPEKLSNYFGENPDSPHYLTPVYFSKDVLTKYYAKPELYEINDGHIRCQGLWILRVDNLNKDYVSVYLGDLGTDIPYKEQMYWKSFNIVPDGKLSKTKFKRDFLAQFADPEIADMKFKQIFTLFKKNWSKKFQWELFLELTEEDKYNFEHLRIPISNSQVEFDGLVLSMVKTLIDSLNEKGLNKLISSSEDIKGSISRLERFFQEQNVTEYESHIKFLRNLQELRSTGSGHRKGKGYKKASERFNLQNGNFAEVFENVLNDAILFIEFLEGKLLHN